MNKALSTRVKRQAALPPEPEFASAAEPVWLTVDRSKTDSAVPLGTETGEHQAVRIYGTGDKPEPGIAKAGPITLTLSMSARNAFTAVALHCLAQMQGNEAAAILGHDPEGVHQLRIGLRRLRALVAAYGDTITVECQKFLARELSWLQQELNAVRDWDVFVVSTLIPLKRNVPEIEGSLQGAQDLRRLAQQQAKDALQSPRYAALLLRCYIWLSTGRWAEETAKLERPIGKFAARVLHRRDQRLRTFGGKRANLSDVDLHRLRILVKKQRYLADFFGGLYRRKTTADYKLGLSKLQDALGNRNDSVVTRRLLSELETSLKQIPANDPEVISRGSGIVLGWQAVSCAGETDRIGDLWKDFRRHRIFWKHSASLARLH